jgi:hypothetical protein
VAGYVAPARDWKELEQHWFDALHEEGAAFYHATDIEANPPRGIYKGWTREQADRLTDKIVPIAAQYAGRGFAVHVNTADWYAILPEVKRQLPNRPHDALFQMLAKACMELVIENLAHDLAPEEKVAFVFEENDFSQVTLEGYSVIRRNNPHPDRFGPLAFEPNKKDAPGLQAADLFAWHYRRVTEIRRGFRNDPVHRSVTQLIPPGSDFIFRFINRDQLEQRINAAIALILRNMIARFEKTEEKFDANLRRIVEKFKEAPDKKTD